MTVPRGAAAAGWATSATVALTSLLLLGGGGCSASHRGEGKVLVARGSPLLLDDGGRAVLVALAPAASLTGIGHLRELKPGDHVSYRWQRALSGVRMAEALDADPVVENDPAFTIREDELAVAQAQHREPMVVDARSVEGFRGGHIPGARSLPFDASEEEIARAIPSDRAAPIVVYGEGARDDLGHRVARRLLAAGATDVKILSGGFQAWTEADQLLELDAGGVADALKGSRPLAVIDTRSREALAAGMPAGAVSVPPDAFRWQDFGGALPLPWLLFVGADALDRSPREVADRVRLLRSSRSVGTVVRFHVLAGGFEAWKRAGLPVERGGELRTSIPYQPLSSLEIPPAEFDALWSEQGGQKATFLDVRRVGTSAEPWVVKIPLEDLPARLGELPRDREIITYCAVGERSRVAAEMLKANGLRARFLRAQPGR